MEDKNPLVSFIIAYYNLPIQMLCECIDSILSLSLAADSREIIVVDDGSDVSPINGLMQYGDDIIYVRQKNGGVSTARNKGIEMATGEYLQFVDADDYLIKSAYDYCIDIVRNDRDVDLVLFDFTSEKTSQQSYNVLHDMSGAEYMLKHNIHGSSGGYIARRKTISKLRFTPGISYGEDEEFTAQLLLRAERTVVTDAIAYYYRMHRDSAVHQLDDECKQRRLGDTMNVLQLLSGITDRLPHNDRKALERRVAQLTMDYIYNVIVLTRSKAELNDCITRLHDMGLFPLPDKDYSQKYIWFRRMSNSALGRAVMLRTLPFMQRER